MAAGRPGGTSFMEDYTYNFEPGREVILGAHMLEVCPSIATETPSCEIHPLGIGGREDPVRLVFDAQPGPAVVVGLADLGERFRLVANEIDVVPPLEPLPKLPVARAVWTPRPNLRTSAEAWLTAGAPHHTVMSSAVGAEELHDLAEMLVGRAAGHRRRHHRPPIHQGAAMEPGLPPPGAGLLRALPSESAAHKDPPAALPHQCGRGDQYHPHQHHPQYPHHRQYQHHQLYRTKGSFRPIHHMKGTDQR